MRLVPATALAIVAAATLPLLAQRSTAARPAPTNPKPAPKTESAVPFHVGETLTYDVSWSSLLTAGTAVAVVKEKKPSQNSSAYYIVAEGRPTTLVSKLYSVYYKMDSTVDAFGLLSQRSSMYSEEGKDRRTMTTQFDRTRQRATFEEKTDTILSASIAIPPQTQDGLAAFYALRGRSLKAGERLTIPVADSGALYTTQVEVGATENIRVPMGQVSAVKLKVGITDAANNPVWKEIAIWMSNDARRLPVKMTAELPVGAFVLALRDAR